MSERFRWEPAVQYFDDDVVEFFSDLSRSREFHFVGAAGFDTLSLHMAEQISEVASLTSATFIREERPGAAGELVSRGDAHAEAAQKLIPQTRIKHIDVFAKGEEVAKGGREAAALAAEILALGHSDIVVDISVLSIGVSFPLLGALLADTQGANIHCVVASRLELEASEREFADAVTTVHGFSHGLGLRSDRDGAAWLWVPHMATGKKVAYGKIKSFLSSQSESGMFETCPVLPFPAHPPNLGDILISEYAAEFEGEWNVDPREILFADESDPCDVYRSLLQLDAHRQAVFRCHDGDSKLILSPLGSKASALGCFLASTERQMPVVYLETLRYRPTAFNSRPATESATKTSYVWLAGEAYQE